MAAENTIPTIDLSPLTGGSEGERHEVAHRIGAACTDTGFFMVVGHGVPQELISKARDCAIEFFALPEAEKDKFDRPVSVARIIRYPAVTKTPLPGQLRAGAHTDYGVMTFVRGDDTPGGLQVKHRNGGWIDVHIPPEAFVCNIGDLMMRWSNDRWVSTLHRVAVPPPDVVPTDRISLVFFATPNPDAVIGCFRSCIGAGEKYPPITAAEHYLGKLMKAGHSRLDADAADVLADPKPRETQTAH